ncbi:MULTISPECIES: hypothetical protein [unclassified Streptomyces]|uniref:hypothetical protein n=1 Tax=unclassified Streptomyces TaxID=2593676 RepID=UPI002740C6B3|nr:MULTISPECIES: hypothetical protein [unclassified Streptomyces]
MWTAPVWLGLIAFYYFYALHFEDSYQEVIAGPLWAPEQVARSLFYFYVFAYAITCGLAVWEGGRLKRDAVWGLAPGRSRFRVAAHVLAPVVAAGWTMLVLPVVMRLVETRLAPTPQAVAPLLLGMGLVVVWAVIGCALGHLTPRLISAPLSMVVVYYLITQTSRMEPVWLRHVSGDLDTTPDFGEYYRPVTLLVPFLFGAAAAVAIAVWWIPAGHRARRAIRLSAVVMAVVVMAGCAYTARGWGYGYGPVSAGHAEARCTGTAPRVCMAVSGGAVGQLPQARSEITRTLHRLQDAGVGVTVPGTVTDSILDGRRAKPSTTGSWRLPLSKQTGRNGPGMAYVRYSTLLMSVTFPCRFSSRFDTPHSADWIVDHDAAMLWAARIAGAEEPYLAWRRSEYSAFQNPGQVLAKVEQLTDSADRLPKDKQADWFHGEQVKACRLAQETGR